MTIKDFSDEEKIFAVALFAKVVEEVGNIQVYTKYWPLMGVPETYRKFMSKYGDLAIEARVAPDVAIAHGLSPYVFKNMTKEKKDFLQDYFKKSLDFALASSSDPFLETFATIHWYAIINNL